MFGRGSARGRIGAGVAAGAVGFVAGTVGLAAPAQADANGCIPAPAGYVCIEVYGDGLHVDRVRAVRGKASWDMICKFSAAVGVHRGPQSLYDYRTGVVRNGECAPGRAYIDFAVNRSFPHGADICIRWFEDNSQQGGLACQRILR